MKKLSHHFYVDFFLEDSLKELAQQLETRISDRLIDAAPLSTVPQTILLVE